MPSIVRYGVVSAAAICALSGAACSGGGPDPFVAKPPIIDTTVTNPSETYIPPTGTATNVPVRKTASSNPIQYWISVPKGWPGTRTWPVIMTIAGSSRDYEANAQLFAKIRDDQNLPFIIVTPVVLTNSGDGPVPHDHPAFQYSAATWDLIDQQGRCAFDLNGMAAIIAEVRAQYGGQSKEFLSGFSGGGHSAWAMVLLQPQLLRGAAPVASNYIGRCVSSESPQPISTAPERVQLPIKTFIGENDVFRTVGVAQLQGVLNLAQGNGYTNISTTVVPSTGHDPMAALVLSYFYSLLGATER